MDKNEILSNDIILIHTAYLGYYYYDFINNIKTNTTFFDIENVANINKHDNHDFNITKVLIDYNSDFKLKIKRQRLANILYKAINICYDKKTDFSKNLIKRTKEALNRYDKSTLLGTPNSIIFSDDEKNKYENFKSKITDITNGFEIEYYKWNILKELYEKIEKGEFIKKSNENDNIIFKNLFQDKFLFYTEEDSEIINGNICKSGELLNSSNTCKSCSIECGTKEQCSSNLNCKIFCETNCIADKNETTNCGGTTDDDVEPSKQKQKEIKTPIEEETNIPDFTIIFKYAIKIFFILIVLYIAYMFYKIFNESILTFGNIFYGFFDWLFYLFSNNIKKAEHYENIIQDKYNTIIRKTMT
jgi:hypothetical protein